jgi:hypothetical protein
MTRSSFIVLVTISAFALSAYNTFNSEFVWSFDASTDFDLFDLPPVEYFEPAKEIERNEPAKEIERDEPAKEIGHNKLAKERERHEPTKVIRFNGRKKRVMSHYFTHIPKSGSTYSMQTVQELVWKMPEVKALPKAEKFRVCDQGKTPTKMWNKRYLRSYKGINCTMWMSEDTQGFKAPAKNNYIILRKPKAHVISQYFHCKESRDHRQYSYKMPSLDEWLQTWVDVQGLSLLYNATKRFYCYNPINSQSKYTNIMTNNTFTGRTVEERKELMRSRYTILGDNSQMAKTTCAIAIRYSGWVPQQCNCTAITSQEEAMEKQQPNIKKKFSHGVKHHGATFETTQRQNELIANLTDVDQLLYEVGTEIFQEQVRAIETEYQFQMCDEFRDLG